jgi:hypothetical protein
LLSSLKGRFLKKRFFEKERKAQERSERKTVGYNIPERVLLNNEFKSINKDTSYRNC